MERKLLNMAQLVLIVFICMLFVINAQFVKSIDDNNITISDIYPNGTNANYNPRLSVNVNDALGRNLTVVFGIYVDATDEWTEIGTQTGHSGIFTQHTTGLDQKDVRYHWRVNISEDSGDNSSNKILLYPQTYSFVAEPFVKKWEYNTSATTAIGPLAVDVNGDGIYEVFTSGKGKITCLNGTSGVELWSRDLPFMNTDHNPFEIGDLNNDGIPELVISVGQNTRAFHANDGSDYWTSSPGYGWNASNDKHMVIVDTEGNGYPYVYTVTSDVTQKENSTGRLRKLDGRTGKVLKEVFAWRPCWGGLSAADANNDGKFEIYMGDRSAYYSPPSYGRGIQAFDADNLSLLWYHEEITSSSHIPALIDVNNDGVLDVVVVDQSALGVYVVDGSTGEYMPEKYNSGSSVLGPGHSQFSIWDIDGDGNLELITSKSVYINDSGNVTETNDSFAKVWDLGSWTLNATLDMFDEPPKMADVIGDRRLEIIGGGNDAKIYNSSYALIETIYGVNAIASSLVQDIDADDQNELIFISYTDGLVKVYDTSAYAPTPRVRTNNQYYSERRLGAGVYIPPPGAPQPFIKGTNIADGAIDVQLKPKLSAHVVDYRYDKMDIDISFSTDGHDWNTAASFPNVGNGWYNYTPDEKLQLSTTYYWKVSAVDPDADNIHVQKTFSFTTSASACDEGLELITYFNDSDSDDFGNNANLQQSCEPIGSNPPSGFTFDNTDCNDSNTNVHPGAIEICDGIDNNCDGNIDDLGDTDADGFFDCVDNCPFVFNFDQNDSDNDAVGDACECGDGTCDDTENCTTCEADCGTCPLPAPFCGDSTCDLSESCSTCASDCGACQRHSGGGGGGSSTPAVESWNCGSWSDCIAGKQTQECTALSKNAKKTNTQNCTLLIQPTIIEEAEPVAQGSQSFSAETAPVEGYVNGESEITLPSNQTGLSEVTGAVTGATTNNKPVWALVAIGIIIAGIFVVAFGKLKKKPVPTGRSRYMEE